MTASPLVWLLTALSLCVIVAVDLVVISRRQRGVTIKDATAWVIVYVTLAALFGLGLLLTRGAAVAEQFAAGYVTEYGLSVDNLFVFLLILTRFRVPVLAQDKVLYIGIVVSLVLRAACIAAGAAALAAFNWVFYLFGALLFYTALRVLMQRESSNDDDFREYRLLRVMRRMLPMTPYYDSSRIISTRAGQRAFTPMIIVISAIGIANLVFALDSIPAIFGLTRSGYIVFTANAFALMGLRQLYFLVGGLLHRLVYLNVGLAVVLGFVGVKLIIEALDASGVHRIGALHLPTIGIASSLTVVLGTLAMTAIISLLASAHEPGETSES